MNAHWNSARAALVALVMLGATDLPPALAADLPPASAAASPVPPIASQWNFQATAYGWATALNGDIGVRNLPTTAVDVPFSEVLDNLDGALMGSFLGSNGQWMFIADLVLAKLSHSGSSSALGGSALDAGLTETIATGAIGYVLPTGRQDLEIAVTGGLRYVRLEADISLDSYDLPIGLAASQAQWWIDPTVGLFMHWDINDQWFVNGIVDIGGFGVGSKISSTGYLGLGYMWTRSFSTAIGYRYLYEDYEGSGAKTGTFRYDTIMHGPTVSLAWHF